MNSLPAVAEVLALLDALRNQVRDFVAREDKLESEVRLGTAAEMRDYAARKEVHEKAALEQEVRVLADAKAEEAECRQRFLRRKEWVNRAHAAVSRGLLAKLSEEDAACKERTQQGVQDAERRRDEGLAAAAAAHDELLHQLQESDQALAQLEQSVRSAFRGYGRFRRLLAARDSAAAHSAAAEAPVLFAARQQLLEKLVGSLAQFEQRRLPRLFKFLPVWLPVVVLFGLAVADPLGIQLGKPWVPHVVAALAAAGGVLFWLGHFLGGRGAAVAAGRLAEDLMQARTLGEQCQMAAAAALAQEQARLKEQFETTKAALNQAWRQTAKRITSRRGEEPAVIDEQAARLARDNARQQEVRLDRIRLRQEATLTDLKAADQAQFRQLTETHQSRMRQWADVQARRWDELATAWRSTLQPLCEQLQAMNAAADRLCPAWELAAWKDWTPPARFQNAARFARLEGSVEKFLGPLPKDARLPWFGPATLTAPLSLVCPGQGSLLFESGKSSGDAALHAINNLLFRLLATTPPGKLSFTIFDPVGLGQNFAGLTHLADYEESSLDSRIWTQAAQFEEKLAELNEHMEKVIQMYLRNEYATIAEYNDEAGSVAEKYHFLVIASFPVNFTDVAARRLRNIAASGARCGVFTLIHWDQRNALPADFVPDELRQNSVCLSLTDAGFVLSNWRTPGLRLLLDPPPPSELATDFLRRIGELSRNSTRVEVPFETVAPGEDALWQEETTDLLRVPIGRSGATKLQYLEIGSGTRQHALIAGKTGSGKSTLFHVIITNLALRCSPAQVEFYLVDFKKGVEFKCYGSRRLPHARVVAIESDREFGLSVLQRVDEELRRRGDLFRQVGAQDLAGYKRAGGGEAIPRTLLLIDEFQEFFTEEDRVSQGAAVLLDRIVRQGRAFGIHVLLGSQTLGGAYTLARATIGQMVIRIALQCNEADALLIMDQDNPAPRLLSRPGEGIYNDAAGAIEGNSPFQAVWLTDRTRDEYLARIRARADQQGDRYPGPIVFEGNAPAEVRENRLLSAALRAVPTGKLAAPTVPPRIWLGAPNSIKGPTEAVFQRQSGGNLLVVGQSEERTLTLLSVALVALAAQLPREAAQFVVLDSTPAGFPQRVMLERLAQALPHRVTLAGNSNLAEVMASLADELQRRGEQDAVGPNATSPEIFVLIQGLQNFKKLRQEDEFSFSSSSSDAPNPAATLMKLLTEGPGRGLHVLVTCDTYNNVARFLGRKALTEFEMRVVFQMSASDSASLIDAPAAATLGLNRALLYNDREGSLETFRPYAQPDGDWLEAVIRGLAGGGAVA